MKNLFITLVTVFVSTMVLGQTTTENYVKSTTYKKEFTENTKSNAEDDEKVEAVTYFDGLGRPIQSVNQRAGGSKEDIITVVEYDAYGRQTKEYLPYATSSNVDGEYFPNIISNDLNPFYSNKFSSEWSGTTPNPYSEKVIENSPLGRVFEQAAPGEDWKLSNDRTIKFDYLTNNSYEVKRLKVTFDNGDTEKPLLISDDYYLENTLYKSIVKDENWTAGKNHTTEEFKDKNGRVILKRTYADVNGVSTTHDTYYAYDNFGNLTFVVPPLAADSVFDETTTGSFYNTDITSFTPSDIGLVGDGEINVGIIDMGNGLHEYSINFNLTNLTGTMSLGDVITLPNADNLSDALIFRIKDASDPTNGYDFNILNGKINITLSGNHYAVTTIQKNNTYVLPTQTGSSTYTFSINALDDLCYQYKYDSRNRLVEKKIPGKGWEYIVYNKLDQPIATQDAEMRLTNSWLFTKYDILGRVAYTGTWSSNYSYSRDEMQQDLTVGYSEFETRTVIPELTDGQDVYYTSAAFPTDASSYSLLTINYYDDYDWNPEGGIEASYTVTHSSNVSFANGTLTKTTATNSWDAGFVSDQNKTINGDGYIQYTVNQTDKRIVVGLSRTDETLDEGYISINYGIYTDYGTSKKVYIYEEGISITPPPTYFEIGDEFRVERSGSQILYKKNGETFYASTTPVTTELIGDGSFYHQNASISDVHVGFTALEQTLTNNVKGLPTGSLVRVLGTGDWITTTSYYNVKGNPIQIVSENEYLESSDVASTLVDFVNKPLKTVSTHIKGSNNAIVIEDNFIYDHADRMLEQFQQINDGDTERIIQNKYDELGQLVRKNVGGTIPSISTYNNISTNIIVNGITISKPTGSSSWSDGVSTQESISDDGYVSVVMPQSNKTLKFGLTYITKTATDDMDFSIAPQYNGKVRVYENGANLGDKTTYIPGDNLMVRRTGTTIDYLKNGEVFYTSIVASTTASMRGDAFLYHVNGSIQNFAIVNEKIGLQQVDYTYNIRGWLKNINEDAFIDNDLFNFSLMYNNPNSGTALFNGNISQTSWNTLNTDSSIKTYTYEYDALNRIISGENNDGKFNLVFTGYDKNGNILELKRNGHLVLNPDLAVPTDFGVMDNLTYSYTGNQLTKVDDLGNSIYGFKNGINTGNDYTYDVNGNMKSDANKEITNIQYNYLNLPTKVTFADTNFIEYIYDATGVKLEKIVSTNSGDNLNSTLYAGNYVYDKTVTVISPSQTTSITFLQFFNHTEGYVDVSGLGNLTFDYIYQYKDHLGNIRLSYADADNNGTIATTEIVEENNYYPFGLKHKGYNNVSTSSNTALKFKYNDVEFEEALGLNMYEMDMRSYDPAIARWTGIDPVTHHSMSTYTAFDNNPIFWADPSGANSDTFWSSSFMNQSGGHWTDSFNESDDEEEEKSTENEEPLVYIYGEDANSIDTDNLEVFDLSEDTQLVSSILGLYPFQKSDPNEIRNMIISGVIEIAFAVAKPLGAVSGAGTASNGMELNILPSSFFHEDRKDSEAMDRRIDYERALQNPYDMLNYVENNNLLLIFSEVNLFEKSSYNSTDNYLYNSGYAMDAIGQFEGYENINYIYIGINHGNGDVSIIHKSKL